MALVHIAGHIEALERPARREPHLQSATPGLAVPKIGQAIALEVVVGDVELVPDAEFRRSNRLGATSLDRHADQFWWEQLAEVDGQIGRVREVRVVVLPPILRRQLLSDANAQITILIVLHPAVLDRDLSFSADVGCRL